MTPKKNSTFQSVIQFTLIFFIVYIGSQIFMDRFFPDANNPASQVETVQLAMVDAKFSTGHHPEITIKNNTTATITLPTCPLLPVQAERYNGTDWQLLPTESDAICSAASGITDIAPSTKRTITLAPWKYTHFNEVARYRLTVMQEDMEPQMVEFAITEPNTLVALFRRFVTRPLLNAIVYIASLLPGHNLGWAIIVVTIITKLILYIPTHSALKSQRKMQTLQPKIDALRKKHKNDPQALNKATLELWKQEKVNPFQSCLPLLIQFPILLGLFFVIRDGGVLEVSQHLLYASHQALPWSFGTNWLGLDLLKPNIAIMPALLVALQFTQLKLSFAQAKKKRKDVVDVTPKKDKKKDGVDQASAQELQQKFMLYGLPIMIGVFAVQFPAAVSLYWATSTFFAIAQQLAVNKAVK